MKHPKSYYRDLEFHGYVWGGWDPDEKRHFFIRTVPEKKEQISPDTWRITPRTYLELLCTDEQIENGTAERLAKNNLSYPNHRKHHQ